MKPGWKAKSTQKILSDMAVLSDMETSSGLDGFKSDFHLTLIQLYLYLNF